MNIEVFHAIDGEKNATVIIGITGARRKPIKIHLSLLGASILADRISKIAAQAEFERSVVSYMEDAGVEKGAIIATLHGARHHAEKARLGRC